MEGFWWALIASLIWGLVPLVEKLGLGRVDPILGLFYRCVGVSIGLIFLVIFILKPSQIKSIDIKSSLLLISGGLLASFIGQIAFYKALKTGDISKIVPIAGSYPFISFILGIFFLKEPTNPLKFLGVILIIIGIWLLK
ncbi:MAG: EamA family transporter [Candidatus Omnitrophica bacterium]|nr:EamA family transporter [Candidatus Omnitrophota bacterium]